MMRLPPFRLRHAHDVLEAVSILAGEPGTTRAVAGGTDLWPNMKRRHQMADTVVTLGRIDTLRGVRGDPGTGMRIGALTRLVEIAEHPIVRGAYPAFARAVASISSPLLRNMGTIGGNLCLDTRCTYSNQHEEWRRSIASCMKAEGEICWVAPGSPRCWAISASDAAPILCALGARVRLVGPAGERAIDLPALYRDDGIAYLTKKPDEILTEVLLPPAGSHKAAFWKLRRRGPIDFAVLTAAAVVWLDGRGAVERASVYLGAVNSYPTPVAEAAVALAGAPLTAERIHAAAESARKAATPMDNTDFAARWRGQMTVRYLEAALREIAGLDPGILPPKH